MNAAWDGQSLNYVTLAYRMAHRGDDMTRILHHEPRKNGKGYRKRVVRV